MDGDMKRREKKHLHKKLRHPKGKHKKNHMGGARAHKHLDGVRHHHAGEHAPRHFPLGDLGADHPRKSEMSMARKPKGATDKKAASRREKRLEGVTL